jgi:hypothetical protein
MVTRLGEQLIYDNLGMGAAIDEETEGQGYLIFQDKDNEEVHMMKISLDKWEQYKRLVDQTFNKVSVEVAPASALKDLGGQHG